MYILESNNLKYPESRKYNIHLKKHSRMHQSWTLHMHNTQILVVLLSHCHFPWRDMLGCVRAGLTGIRSPLGNINCVSLTPHLQIHWMRIQRRHKERTWGIKEMRSTHFHLLPFLSVLNGSQTACVQWASGLQQPLTDTTSQDEVDCVDTDLLLLDCTWADQVRTDRS